MYVCMLSPMLCIVRGPWLSEERSFHQNQIKLFIMIKGGLLYALKKKFWEMLSPLIVGPKPTKETQLEV